MSLFEGLKLLHVICAALSATGFALRGYWMLSSHPLSKHRVTRILPHTIDTVLLASAVGMLVIWGISPFAVDWLQAKIIALLLYIGLGMIAMRFGRRRSVRIVAYWLALACVFYIVTVAFTKSPAGPLALI